MMKILFYCERCEKPFEIKIESASELKEQICPYCKLPDIWIRGYKI